MVGIGHKFSLIAFLIPAREMANIFSKEFAASSKKGPPYIPFAAPKVREKPWDAPLHVHGRANKYWAESVRRSTKDTIQKTSLQCRLLYNIRCIFAGDLCDARNSFG